MKLLHFKGSLKIASLQFFETRSEYEQTFFFNEDRTMHWADVVADSSLENLPYKIELNEHGQILMTPHWPLHSELQSVLQEELNQRMKGGRAVPEYAIRTAAGVRVADVVWRSAARWNEIQAAGKVPAPVAPEICIEVRSPVIQARKWLKSARCTWTPVLWRCGPATKTADSDSSILGMNWRNRIWCLPFRLVSKSERLPFQTVFKEAV